MLTMSSVASRNTHVLNCWDRITESLTPAFIQRTLFASFGQRLRAVSGGELRIQRMEAFTGLTTIVPYLNSEGALPVRLYGMITKRKQAEARVLNRPRNYNERPSFLRW